MKIPIRKEDFETFQKLAKEPGYNIKYKVTESESDEIYYWLHFNVDQYEMTNLLMLMYHAGKRVMMNQLLHNEGHTNY